LGVFGLVFSLAAGTLNADQTILGNLTVTGQTYSEGSLGIGTTSPGNQLWVSGSQGQLNLGATGWNSAGNTAGSIVTDNTIYRALMIVGNNVSGNSGKGREVKVWDYLNVQGPINSTGAGTFAGLLTASGGAQVSGSLSVTGSLTAGGANILLNNTGGNVYLGWAGASNVYMGDIPANSSVFMDANVTIYGTLSQGSDRRLKHGIAKSELGLDFINSIKPVSYYYDYDKENREKHFGVVAQDLLALNGVKDTALVRQEHGGKDGAAYYGVAYTELIAPVIKAIQELLAKVTGMSDRMDQLEKEVASLRSACGK
jgi:hypothetical protein